MSRRQRPIESWQFWQRGLFPTILKSNKNLKSKKSPLVTGKPRTVPTDTNRLHKHIYSTAYEALNFCLGIVYDDQSSRCSCLSRRALSNSVHHHHRPCRLGSVLSSAGHCTEFINICHSKCRSLFGVDIQCLCRKHFDHMGKETYHRMGMDS